MKYRHHRYSGYLHELSKSKLRYIAFDLDFLHDSSALNVE